MTTAKEAAAQDKALIPPAREWVEKDDGLTDEEREALAEGGEEDVTAELEDHEPEAEEAEAAAEDEEAAPVAAAPADADPEQEAAPAPATAQAPAATVAPVLIAAPAAEAEAKLADIETQKADALTKFDDGDMTAREYQEAVDKLGKEERKLEREIDRAKLAGELQEQASKNAWYATCDGFIAAHPVYSAATNPRMNRLFNAEVIDIANSEEGKSMGGSDILTKAHANLVEAGIVAETATPAAAKPARAAIPKKELPPTLARVPATNVNDTEDNKYAALDRLQTTDPIAYEEKLMAMSESQRRAYEAA